LIAFIDESGDEGTDGKGSRWLILGCAMVSDASLDLVRNSVNVACALVGRRHSKGLHFKDLSHDDRRGIISEIISAPWYGTIVASDTTRVLPDSYLKIPTYQFN
jgi:hypothetical protein